MVTKRILIDNQLVPMTPELLESIELDKSGLKRVKPIDGPEKVEEVKKLIKDIEEPEIEEPEIEGGVPLSTEGIYPSTPMMEWTKAQLLSYCDYIDLYVPTAKNKTFIVNKIKEHENQTSL